MGPTGTPFERTFLDTLSKGYDAPLQKVDFKSDPSAAASRINDWVSQETQGKITNLLGPGDLDRHSRLVLVNAIFFKADWENGFDPARTTPMPFTLASGEKVSVPTMDGLVDVGSGQDGTVAVYEVAYRGKAMVIDFVVPTDPLEAFEAGLTGSDLRKLVRGIGGSRQVELEPRGSPSPPGRR